MPRKYFEGMDYVMSPFKTFDSAGGAVGQFAQPQVIIPPGWGQNQGLDLFNNLTESFMQNMAQKKSQEQYNEAVKGLGEFWPILQATGVTEGQVNQMLRSGMSPKDITHFALDQEAGRATKGLEWGHEQAVHERGIAEKSFTPDQMDVLDSYRNGEISLSDAMRKSGMSSMQLHEAIAESSAGQSLQAAPIKRAKEDVDLQKAELELKGLPAKQQQEGEKRIKELKRLDQQIANSRTPEETSALTAKREQAVHEFNRNYDIEHPLPTKATSKGLPDNLQKILNTAKQQYGTPGGTSRAEGMFNVAKNNGLKVRPPTNDEKLDTKGSEKYLKVIEAAAKNAALDAKPKSVSIPKGPYGTAAQKIASKYGLDPELFGRLIKQESGWNPGARSPVGAMGFTQLMPDTAKALGVNPSDPLQNLEGGAKYLSQLIKTYKGNVAAALAHYNGGPAQGMRVMAGQDPSNSETRNYIKSILGNYMVPAKATSQGSKKKSLDEIL